MKSSSRTLSTELLADASMRRTSVTSGRNPKMRGFIHVMNYVNFCTLLILLFGELSSLAF
jgi:hypothetical protein